MRLNFQCPWCNNRGLEEISSNHVISDPIWGLVEQRTITGEQEGIEVEYGPSEIISEDHNTDYYQCENCGYLVIGPDGDYVADIDGLVEWLHKNCEQNT